MKILNKIKPYIINSFLIIIIFFFIYFLKDIYPFNSNKDTAIIDALFQYKPMLYNFITSIQNGTITAFSFDNALGSPIYFNYLYYLSSPLNFIALLFKTPEAMFLSVTLIKVFITSITTTYYVRKKTTNQVISTICSISYILCSWFIAYGFNIMWLDAFMMFPIFQYGLEELIQKRKYGIYIFSLSYIMYTNFYIAFIVCIYTLIYFFFNIFIEKSSIKEKILKFDTIALSTLVTFALSFVSLYATYTAFIKMGIPINHISDNQTILTLSSIIKSFFYGNVKINTSSFESVIPNISSSILLLISLIYYFINNKISKKEKITTFIAILFTLFTLNSKSLNYIINCFHVPIGYSFRYSFIFIFYTIIIFLRNVKTFENKIDKKVFLIIPILLIIQIILYCLKQLDKTILLFNTLTLIAYSLSLLFYKKDNVLYKVVFTTIVILECTFCYLLYIPKTNIVKINNELGNEIKEYRVTHFESFSDIFINESYSNNKNLIAFSSMLYSNSVRLLDNMGCNTDNKAIIYTCYNNDLFNTIFNVKQSSNYYLPKIFSVNNKVLDNLYGYDRFTDNLNLLAQNMSQIEEIIETNTIKSTEQKNEYTHIYKIKKINNYQLEITSNIKYIIIDNTIYTETEDLIPKEFKNYNKVLNISERKSIIFTNTKNQLIEISYYNKQDNTDLNLYTINKDKYQKFYEYLKNGTIHYSQYKDNHIKGTITVDNNQLIFTTIPYDDSWEILVDNKKVIPIKIANSLLGVETTPGKHTIEFKYKQSFTIPIVISTTTLIGLIIHLIYINKKQETRKQNERKTKNNYKRNKTLSN